MLWLILVGAVLFIIAFNLGILFHSMLGKTKYGGTIVVEKRSDGVLLYTLEIGGDLEQLQHEKEILFRIKPIEYEEPLDDVSPIRE